MKKVGVKELLERLEEEGLPSSRSWLYNMVNSGKLVLPEFKHTTGKRYNLTPETVDEIISSLKKKGSYNYNDKANL